MNTYSKRFLARRYYPKAPSEQAAIKALQRDINRCKALLQALEKTGYSSRTQHFTVHQTNIIFDYLGEPER